MNPALWQALRDEALWTGNFLMMPPGPPAAINMEPQQAPPGTPGSNPCAGCPQAGGRKDLLFGEGNPKARILIVGEALGYHPHAGGLPVLSPAGSLLSDILEKGMGLARQEVHVAHILGCRPAFEPQSAAGEADPCPRFLKQYITGLGPEVIIAMGDVACRWLLDLPSPASVLRGKFFSFQDIPLMPTHHPAYLLQNPPKKRETWDDIKQVMVMLGMPLSR